MVAEAGGRAGAEVPDVIDVTDVGEVGDLGSAKGMIVESSAGVKTGDRIGLE